MGRVKETLKMKEHDLARIAAVRIYYVAKQRLKRNELSQFNFDQIKRNLTEIETCMFGGESG